MSDTKIESAEEMGRRFTSEYIAYYEGSLAAAIRARDEAIKAALIDGCCGMGGLRANDIEAFFSTFTGKDEHGKG